MKRKVTNQKKKKSAGKPLEGNTEQMISTGSTLLDLAISGTRTKEGGIPGGILVEIFGPSGTGKTVLLCEIAGGVKRAGGEVMFKDPEARLNSQFAKIFDLDVDEIEYSMPNTVPQVFEPIREWKPSDTSIINGIFTDSLAALSTDMEMEDQDKMGMRRAKEFSEQLRKTARTLTDKNFLLVASNQIRDNADAGAFGQKFTTPGGHGIPFYASLRLRIIGNRKLKKEVSVKGKKLTRVIGVETDIEVHKSSVDKPHRVATITILFDYGIDDIRENLKYLKKYKGWSTYQVTDDIKLNQSLDKSIVMVEENGWEKKLRIQVRKLWRSIEGQFESERKPKRR
jgi:recombination protein RecA